MMFHPQMRIEDLIESTKFIPPANLVYLLQDSLDEARRQVG